MSRAVTSSREGSERSARRCRRRSVQRSECRTGRSSQSLATAGSSSRWRNLERRSTTAFRFQMVIFNDGTHTAVKAAQQRTYPGRFVAVDLINPDYVKIAEAYGIEGVHANSPEALAETLRRTRDKDEPTIINVPISLETY